MVAAAGTLQTRPAKTDRAAENGFRSSNRHLDARTVAGLGRTVAQFQTTPRRRFLQASAHPAEMGRTCFWQTQLAALPLGHIDVSGLARGPESRSQVKLPRMCLAETGTLPRSFTTWTNEPRADPCTRPGCLFINLNEGQACHVAPVAWEAGGTRCPTFLSRSVA